jgi:hypothetical protein
VLLAAGALLLVALWLVGDVRASLRYHQALARTGGLSTHSDAINGLAAKLDEQGASQPLALDWGIEAQVRYLTGNRVQPLEIFGYERLDEPDGGFAGRAGQFLDEPGRFFLLRAPEETVFQGRREALEALVAEAGRMLEAQETIYDRSGRAVFEIWRIATP